MNFVFLSPDFPLNYYHFCDRLHRRGARVLGLSSQPDDQLRPELSAALSGYYRVDDLHRYDEVLRGVGYFTYRFGKIDRVDSLNEHWLETEARLRSDFNIAGFKLHELPRIKRKSEMKQLFAQAGINVARGQVVRTADEAHAFASDVGFPLVAKPDIGVGANRTYRIDDWAALDRFLAEQRGDYLLEEFISGIIQTFDGLVDRQGEPIFFTSMQYSQGVMEVVNADGDVYYYTQRDIPADLEQDGRAILRAFDVRERFFHFEFFRTPEGRLVALEVNMRPPGGLSLDLFNYGHNVDMYDRWADLLVYGHADNHYDRPYYACYAGRKHYRPYRYNHAQVLNFCADRLVHHQPMAPVFHRAMGEYGYILRSPHHDEVVGLARMIHELSG